MTLMAECKTMTFIWLKRKTRPLIYRLKSLIHVLNSIQQDKKNIIQDSTVLQFKNSLLSMITSELI